MQPTRIIIGLGIVAALTTECGDDQRRKHQDRDNPASSTPKGSNSIMSTNLIKIANILTVAAGAIGRLTGTAQASTTSDDKSAAAVTMSGPRPLPNYGSDTIFYTWLFGNTRIRAENTGSGAGRAEIQPWGGGGGVTLHPGPGTYEDDVRAWAGKPVTVVNTGDSPLQVWSY